MKWARKQEAGVYRTFIEQQKKKTEQMNKMDKKKARKVWLWLSL